MKKPKSKVAVNTACGALAADFLAFVLSLQPSPQISFVACGIVVLFALFSMVVAGLHRSLLAFGLTLLALVATYPVIFIAGANYTCVVHHGCL